jgi:glycosyltransferase involved in cell wall biosynthesis
MFAWGPTVREIDFLANHFEKIVHIAPMYDAPPSDSDINYKADNVEYVNLIPAGGNGIWNKLKIILTIPYNIIKIHKNLKGIDWVQFRAPTNIGLYTLPYLSLFRKKNKWVKYAGNWIQENGPFSYALQRWWLKKNLQNSAVTINGNWPNQENHLITFENPCLYEKDILEGEVIAKSKNYGDKLILTFIGMLEPKKGVLKLIEALKKIRGKVGIDKVYIIGRGSLLNRITEDSNKCNLKIEIINGMSREGLTNIYKESHIFILPTDSEGFPKVIAEAACYGVVPVVSNVSSIPQYIIDNENGLLLNEITSDEIALKLDELLANRVLLKKLANNIPKLANLFTFEHFYQKLQNQILKKGA